MITKLQLILIDAVLTGIAVFIGLVLRLEIFQVGYFFTAIWPFTLLAVILRPLVFHFTGIYKYIWRYAKTREFLNFTVAILIGSLILTPLTLFVIYPCCMPTFPRSLLGLESLLALVLLGAVRLALKNFEQYPGDRTQVITSQSPAQQALVIGAGSAGTLIVQELRANPQLGLTPIAFLDDDPQKIGRTIHGLPVYGPGERLPDLVDQLKIDIAVIAIPSAPGEIIRKFARLCEQANLPSKIVPGLYEILSGRVGISRLRPIIITDLLRRDQIKVDITQICDYLHHKTVLVTGAGGSIGSELCRQILSCQPTSLIALGHGENSLYGLLEYFAVQGIDTQNLEVLIADIRDPQRLHNIFQRHRPQIVFHAAAHKHVPLMEHNLEDAVTNNVVGTWHLVQTALQFQVRHFVLISTDKAVQPVNIMGSTKRVAELIVAAAAQDTSLPYVAVRFGNVLGSRGSVIPRFQRQIAAGGPITITHPDMERYFMTIPEAVQLVLQAAAMGETGQTFVLDMGQPVKILDLARDMIELSGLQLGQDIEIEYTGLRPGERLTEYIFDPQETCTRTRHQKIFVTRNDQGPTLAQLSPQIETLQDLANAGDIVQLRRLLETLAEH